MLVIETHNDHFINGARKAVKEKEIAADAVLLHYFGAATPDGDAHTHSTIKIDSEGALDQWPKGFFDQYELDLARLAEWE